MQTPTYESIKRALLTARARGREERETYLTALGATDPRLAAEVRELLAHEGRELPALGASWIANALSPGRGAPERLGPYAIDGELGRGGAGVVYLARDPVLGRQVALKVLPPEVARRPARLERFRDEARLLASINHPNIATIHALDAGHDPPFLSLELVEGETLAHRLARGTPALDDTLRIARQIARALEAAHAKGIVHRDLKPANVMVTPAGHVKVVDFGLAVGGGSDAAAPAVAGTPGYMSPEQIEGRAIDPRTDVWALGCVLFECLTGRRAFGGPSGLSRSTRAVEGAVDWTRLPGEVPPSLVDRLRRCLVPHLDDRLPAVAPLREEIDELIFRRKMSRTRAVPAAPGIEPPNNLPPAVDRFVGRGREVAAVAARLERHRLVTLTGAGGTGKTRLALEVARRASPVFTGGVWFVDLAALETSGSVVEATVRALGLGGDGTEPPLDRLAAFLATERRLLILDNCEHVRAAAAEVAAQLVTRVPVLCILATSREVLRVAGEVPVPVHPLRVGGAGDARSEAAELFVQRAATADPDWDVAHADAPAIETICRRLDGVPLAIELAAARVRALTVQEIAERLADRFALLGATEEDRRARSISSRHRSLHALIDWTHQQLSSIERIIFRRLSVFRGGWTLAAAEAVCTDGEGVEPWAFLDAYIQLVEKSLVQRDGEVTGDRSRHRLFESVRAFAAERLEESGEAERVTRAHLTHVLAQAEASERTITGTGQSEWVSRLDADYANYRHALDVSLGDGAGAGDATGDGAGAAGIDPILGMRLAAALGEYWQMRGYYRDASAIYCTALARPESREVPEIRVRLLAWAGNVALALGRYGAARAHHEEGAAACEAADNRRGLGGAINGLGIVAWREGDIRRARAHYLRAAEIWDALGEERLTGVTLNNIGVLDMETGDYANARANYARSLAIHERLGNRHAVGVLQANVALAAMQLGDHDDAHAAFTASLAIRRELGDRAGVAHALNGLGSVLERRGEPEAARPLLNESLEGYEAIGDRVAAAVPLLNLGFIALQLGGCGEAEAHFARAHSLAGDAGDRANTARASAGLGMVDVASGRHAQGARRLHEALAALHAVEDRWGVTLVLEALVSLFARQDEATTAASIAGFLESERAAMRAPRTAAQAAEHAAAMETLGRELSPAALRDGVHRGRSTTITDVLAQVDTVLGSEAR